MEKTADRHARGGQLAPKDVGRQLRQVRRKQGLSRGEVARSAGLTRRELAAYERGRAAVPESDLWCLAGSCGVDVGELLPQRAPVKVSADLSLLAVGDSIRYLRNPIDNDELLREYMSMIYELRNVAPGRRVPLRERDLMALADALGGSPENIEARLIELIGVSQFEAARLCQMILPAPPPLPEAPPLPTNHDDLYGALRGPGDIGTDAQVVDFFSPPRASDPFEPPPPPPPSAQPAAATWDAPSLPVDPFGAMPDAGVMATKLFDAPAAFAPAFDPMAAPRTRPTFEPSSFEPSGDEPPSERWMPVPEGDQAVPLAWAPEANVRNAPYTDARFTDAPFTDATLSDATFTDATLSDATFTDATIANEATMNDPTLDAPRSPVAAPGVGPPDYSPPDLSTPDYSPPDLSTPDLAPPAPRAPLVRDLTAAPEPEPSLVASALDEVAPIAWVARADLDDPPPIAMTGNGSANGFVRAGANWRIGGIFPATAAADDGTLALRRADARWALADIQAPGDFTVEAVVDFTAGVGFGVLFRATIDDTERISGYSFDIDPIAGGGGYLVRQWEDNRQHWRPLVQAGVTDPSRLFGRHLVSVTLRADQLTVLVDGEPAVTLPSLTRSSVELGQVPCRGAGVGVQAWATTEVTVESFRVARH